MSVFLPVLGLSTVVFHRCDQGGELVKSKEFRTTMEQYFNYKVEPSGASGPSQNGSVERWNLTFGTSVCAILYGADLEAHFWSVALVHAVYLRNQRVHTVTKSTLFELWHGIKPDLWHVKVFRLRICVN